MHNIDPNNLPKKAINAAENTAKRTVKKIAKSINPEAEADKFLKSPEGEEFAKKTGALIQQMKQKILRQKP